MKKAYETPVAEKLEFDYTQAVVASNTGSQNLFGTSDEQWCHTAQTSTDAASRC